MLSPAKLEELRGRLAALSTDLRRQLGDAGTSERDRTGSTVSDCSEVDFERGQVAEARQSGDVRAALERLTARVGEVRAARAAHLAAEGNQVTETARAAQQARRHVDDYTTAARVAEPDALDRCSDGDAA